MTAAALTAAPRSDLADVPARWSWLSHFYASPLHARHAALYGKEPTAAMKLGTAGHVVTFDEPFEVFRTVNGKTGKVYNRSSKEWKAQKAAADAAGVTLLTVKEYDHACRMRDALRGHPDAAPLLFGAGVVRERPIHWHRGSTRRVCSSRPDARKPGDWIADLKTCRTAKPEKFTRAAQWSGYPGQLAYYREADCFELGRHVDSLHAADLYIVAIEPFAPYAITVFELDASARAYGERQVDTCWGRLVEAEATNRWPAYTESIAPFVIEEDEDGELTFLDDDAPATSDDTDDDL